MWADTRKKSSLRTTDLQCSLTKVFEILRCKDLFWHLLLHFTFFRAQRGSDCNLPMGVRWVRHTVFVSHPNHSMSATILPACYASTESLEILRRGDVIRALYVENTERKAIDLPTSEFVIPLSEIAMQMYLITWRELTSKGILYGSGDYEVTFARFSLYMWQCR